MILLFLACPAAGQESQFASDLRREREHIAGNCGELATDYPFHVALGSLAPQNGFAFGVAAPSGSWRAGAYMKIIHTPDRSAIVVRPAGSQPGSNTAAIREYPVLNVYAQTISLDKLWFFGPGPSTTEAGQSVFSERQTIIGTNGIWPIPTPDASQRLRPSFAGGLNARFTRVRGNTIDSTPSIADLYDDRTAPGLGHQPAPELPRQRSAVFLPKPTRAPRFTGGSSTSNTNFRCTGKCRHRDRETSTRSVTVGLTVRAGGLPVINFSFAWGAEGHHVIGTMDTSLLGGSGRPSLH